jgi:hypothetical protein
MQTILLRLSQLDQHLKSHVARVVKTRELAETLEVSSRTVRRYVSILRGYDRDIEANPEGLMLKTLPETDLRDYFLASPSKSPNTEFLLNALNTGAWVLIRPRSSRRILEARPLVLTGKWQEYVGSTLIADVAVEDRQILKAFRLDKIECLGPVNRAMAPTKPASYDRIAKVIMGKDSIAFAA